MKVLLVYMDGFAVCFQEIVATLRSSDIEVVIIEVTVAQPNDRSVFLDPEFIDHYKAIHFDYIIWCEHSTSKEMEHFERELAIPSICIEHDLLTLRPQTSLHNEAVFAFTKPHYKWLVDHHYHAIKAQFYKADLKPTLPPEPGLNAVVIGSEYVPFTQIMHKEVEFKHAHLFDKVYYKPYGPGETPIKGTLVHPETLGAHGTRNCAQLAKYWFIVNSSSYIDALLFGCIPIVLGGDENPYFKDGLFYGQLAIDYLSDGDVETIIKEGSTKDLRSDWLFEATEQLPTVASELIKLLL